MVCLHSEGELSDDEIVDLMGFVNAIITHITDGNKNEERLVNIMGGTVIETESEKLIRFGKNQGMQQGIQQGMQQGRIQMLIEIGHEDGLEDAAILRKLQDKVGLTMEQAAVYLKQYGKDSVQK
ncbi:MAG: hypothetical protein NC489_43575 [Ruminococcus flavefaciens]|nr:hypothetical protein [Ruminococcus flavefaciens]